MTTNIVIKEKDYGTFHTIAKLLKFSAPICSTNLIGVSANFFSIILIARLGEEQLAASALATTTYTAIFLILSSTLYSVSILTSYHKSKLDDDRETLRKIFQNGVLMSLMLSILGCLTLWQAESILKAFHQDETLINIMVPYFHYAALSFFPLMLSVVISQFLIGLGTPRFTLITAIIRVPFLLFFSYCFILGEYHCKAFGLAGIMVATALVQTLYCIGLIIFLMRHKIFSSYRLFYNFFLFDNRLILKLASLGLPISTQFAIEILAIVLLTYLLGLYGSTTLAASQVVSQFSLLIIMLFQGIAHGLSTLTGVAYGKKNKILVNQYKNASIIINLILFAMILVVFTQPQKFIQLFIPEHLTTDSDFLYYMQYFFWIAIATLFFDGFRMLFSSILRGLQKSKFPLYACAGAIWLLSLPTAYLLSFYFHLGPLALNTGFIAGLIVATGLLYSKIQREISML